MANFYSQFALGFEPASPEQAAFIQEAFTRAKALRDSEDEDEDKDGLVDWLNEHGIQTDDTYCFLSSVRLSADKAGLFLYSDDSGNSDDVAELIAAAQRKFNDDRPFGFEVSYSCDKARPDGFGGVAIFIHKGAIEYMGTGGWLRDKMAEAEEEPQEGRGCQMNGELAERAVACKHWRWVAGMQSSHGARYLGGDCWVDKGAGGVVYADANDGELPDLDDPATLGCLLALVREAHGKSVWLLATGKTEAAALVAALEAAP